MKPRIYADFNKRDENGSAILVCRGTFADLQSQGLTLADGMEVTLYMPDDVDSEGQPDSLKVDAIVRHNRELGCWVGEFVDADLGYRSQKERKQ